MLTAALFLAACQNPSLVQGDKRLVSIPDPPAYLTTAAVPCDPVATCAGQSYPEVAERRALTIRQQNTKIAAAKRDWAAMKKKLEQPLR